MTPYKMRWKPRLGVDQLYPTERQDGGGGVPEHLFFDIPLGAIAGIAPYLVLRPSSQSLALVVGLTAPFAIGAAIGRPWSVGISGAVSSFILDLIMGPVLPKTT